MFWKIRAKYHIALAQVYSGMYKEEDKLKRPNLYARADAKWRYHAQKACDILSEKLKRMMEGS